MSDVYMAFYGEGSTDDRFLPRIIERTAKRLRPHAGVHLTVIPKDEVKAETEAETILKAAAWTQTMHLLIYHLDADGPADKVPQTRADRLDPGLERVRQAEGEVCKDIVPVIPVHTLEAWVLADPQAIVDAVGTGVDPKTLKLPRQPHQVEAEKDPKGALSRALTLACPNRSSRRRSDPGRYFATLGETISLDKLDRVPAFRAFTEELDEALRRVHI